jgi:hypothetical protein
VAGSSVDGDLGRANLSRAPAQSDPAASAPASLAAVAGEPVLDEGAARALGFFHDQVPTSLLPLAETRRRMRVAAALVSAVARVSSFYERTHAGAVTSCQALRHRASVLQRVSAGSASSDTAAWLRTERAALKGALVDLYRSQLMLASFCSLNYIGFDKLLRKLDRAARANLRRPVTAALIHQQRFASDEAQTALACTVALFADVYEGGKLAPAQLALNQRSMQSDFRKSDMLRLGAKLGVVLCLLAVVCSGALTEAAAASAAGSAPASLAASGSRLSARCERTVD